jgi:hypothetical protein
MREIHRKYVSGKHLRQNVILEDMGIDGRMILKMDVEKIECKGVNWIPMVGSCEQGNYPLGSIKMENFLSI